MGNAVARRTEDAEEEVEEYYEEEAEEEEEEKEEEELEYYEEEEGYYNATGTGSSNKFKDYQTKFTNKVNESYLPEGYYLTETQLTLLVLALFASVTALIIIAYKSFTAEKTGSEYLLQ